MGNFYVNVTLLDVSDDAAVRGVLGDGPAFIGRAGTDTIVFPGDEDSWTSVGRALSAALEARAVGVSIHDDDILGLTAWANGACVYEVSVPDPAEYFGMSFEEMGLDDAVLAEMGLDGGESPGHDSTALVAALGRGDVAQLDQALAADFVFATERHGAVAQALGLPLAAVGGGFRYLVSDPDEFSGDSLTRIP